MIGLGIGIPFIRPTGGGAPPFVGLLDTYPNASAAYSVRLLRAAYSGNAIRVRRASDNAEQNIGFVSGALDIAALTTFCSGTNGFVTTWYDQSGNGYNATQTTASNQPQIVSSGSVLTLNGKPSIFFYNNFINSGTICFNTFTQLTLNNVGSIYCVNSYQENGDFQAIFSNGYDASDGIWVGKIQNQKQLQLWAGNNNTQSINNSFTINTQLLNSYFFESGVPFGQKIYVNNTLDVESTKTYVITPPINNGGIGRDQKNNAYPFYGYMNEIIFYSEKTNINNNGISTEINTYYAIY